MLLPPFQLHQPKTVEEAVRLKADHPDSDFVAGGTDLLPNYKWGLNTRGHVISLAHVEGLRDIGTDRLGALVTLTQIEKSSLLGTKLPVLPQTARQIATPLLRHSATLGGNLMLENRCFFFNQTYLWRKSIDFCLKAGGEQCHVVPQKETCYATFSADLPASLIALDASMELASPKGKRVLKLADFYNGPDGIHRNDKQPDEMIVGVQMPRDAITWRASYHKLRLRDSFDFPELGVAAAIRTEGGNLAGLRLVVNAIETKPVVLDQLGERATGNPLTDEAIDAIAAEAEQSVRPVKNTNLPPSYRKAMVKVFVKRALGDLRGHA